jgi:transcriptional accessory protein Tex/SPT6
LYDTLEEVNIRVVNEIGVDLNLVMDHEHMHCILQFLSGLGPRKAKNFVVKFNSKFKNKSKKLSSRDQMLKENLIEFKVFYSLLPFVMIHNTKEKFENIKINSTETLKCNILDQTRIHHEHYKLAMKIATDACSRSQGIEDRNEISKDE